MRFNVGNGKNFVQMDVATFDRVNNTQIQRLCEDCEYVYYWEQTDENGAVVAESIEYMLNLKNNKYAHTLRGYIVPCTKTHAERIISILEEY